MCDVAVLVHLLWCACVCMCLRLCAYVGWLDLLDLLCLLGCVCLTARFDG